MAFEGSAHDPEDGDLTGASLVWSSSLDGEIGTGGSFTTSSLSAGTHTITLTATDSRGQTDTARIELTISQAGPLTITTSSLPPATVGEEYSAQLQATGGDGAYEWTLVLGTLPSGLDLSTDGVISGTPDGAPGFVGLKLQVSSGGSAATRSLALEVKQDGGGGGGGGGGSGVSMAHYGLNEISGETTPDLSGNSLHATVHGNPGIVPGVKGSALQLDGIDDWVSTEDHAPEAFSVMDFTLSFWFRTSNPSQQHLVQSTDGSGYGQANFGGAAIRTTDDLEAGYRPRANGPKCEIHARDLDLADGEWHHFVIRRDADEGGTLFMDGEATGSCEEPDPGITLVPQSFLRFGYGVYDPKSYESYFQGFLDDIRVYGEALSDAEISGLCDVPSVCGG